MVILLTHGVFRVLPLIVISIVGQVVLSVTQAQTPKLDSAGECSDWFLANRNILERKYACVGELRSVSNDGEGSVTVEWFEVKFNDPTTQKHYSYSELRKVYANGVQANWWEKWMNRDEDFFWCMGDYETKLARVNKSETDIDGKPMIGVKRASRIPEPLEYTILTGSAFVSTGDGAIEKFFADTKLLQSEESDDGSFKGFFARKHSGTEILFNSKFDYMPTSSRGLFRKNYRGELTRESYEAVNFDSKSRWEKIGSNLMVPVAITNVVHRVNPKVKESHTLDLKVAWSIDGLSTEIFSDSSIKDFENSTGTLFKIKSKLQDKLQTISLPSKED